MCLRCQKLTPMTDSDTDRRHEIALFRYGLIADLARLQPGAKGLYTKIEQKAAAEYAIPGSESHAVSALAPALHHTAPRSQTAGTTQTATFPAETVSDSWP
jgi:hypothetical protein